MEYFVLWALAGLFFCLVCNHMYYNYIKEKYGTKKTFWGFLFSELVLTIPLFMFLGPVGVIMIFAMKFGIIR